MLPSSMNYYKRMDAMGIEKIRMSSQPSNGSTFLTSENSVEFTINGNRNLFANFKDAYFTCIIKNKDGTNDKSLPDKIGTASLIKKVTVETSSSNKLSSVENWNVLFSMKLAESVDTDWLESNGNVLLGTSSTFEGDSITSGNSITKIIPLSLVGIAGNSYIPLNSRENLKITFELESSLTAVMAAGGTANDIELSACKFYYDAYRLSEPDFKKIMDDLGGVYRVTTDDWLHQSETIAASNEGTIVNIGFSRRKMKNLYFCLRTQSKITASAANSVTSRNKAGITSYKLLHNGVTIHSNAVNTSTSDESETFAELLKAGGGLLNLHTNSLGTDGTFNLAEGSAITALGNCGSFFAKINLERGMESEEAVDGISVDGNFQLEIVKGTTTADQRLDIFVEYVSEYVLDHNDGSTWAVYS